MARTAAGKLSPSRDKSTRTKRQSAVILSGNMDASATSCTGTPNVCAAPTTRLENMRSEETKRTAATSRRLARDVVLGVELLELFEPQADVILVLARQIADDQLPVKGGRAFLQQLSRLGARKAPNRIGADHAANERTQKLAAQDLLGQHLVQPQGERALC